MDNWYYTAIKPNSKKNGKNMAMPLKYNESVLKQVDEYLKTTGREQTSLPTIEGLAIFLKHHKDTLYEWGKRFPKFKKAMDNIMQIQKQQLIDDGIYGGKEVNSTIVKLLLQNNHGMREKTDVTTNDKDLPVPIYGSKSAESE